MKKIKANPLTLFLVGFFLVPFVLFSNNLGNNSNTPKNNILNSNSLTCSSTDPSSSGIIPAEQPYANAQTCDATYSFYRINSPSSGTYILPSGESILITITSTTCGPVFSVSSSEVVFNNIIAKGGTVENVYSYPTDVSGDGDLHSPLNPSNGMYFGLSHMDFCYKAGCIDPDIPTLSSNTPRCNGDDLTLTITGNLNGASEWVIYDDVCGGNQIGTTSTSTFTTSITNTTTYYVRGEGGCTTLGSCGSITVSVPTAVEANASGTDVVCLNDGTATASPSGGTSPYSYAWNTGAITPSITGLSAGTYTVTVTDTNLCSDTESIVISAPASMTLAFSSTPSSCDGETDGSASVTVSAGSSPYTYTWSNGGATSEILNVSNGTYSVTVTDSNGCTVSGSVEVLFDDSIAPTAVCQNITIQLDDAGNATITAVDIDGGSSDACGVATLAIDAADEDWTCAEVGTNTVTLTVTDVNGNESSCEATVTVEDNIAPTAVCLNITVELDATGNATITAVDIDGGSSDACGVASLEIAADDQDWICAEVGEQTVTLTVTDVNDNVSTCDATVTVEDNIAPTAVCQNITIQLDATGNVTITAVDIDGGSSDACGVATLAIDAADEDWTCAEVGTNTVTLTITDVNGNVSSCEATVTVEDNIAPTAVCQNITIQLDDAGNATITAVDIDGGSSDACGVATLAIDAADEDWTCTEVGANTVTLTVTDVNGNVSSCEATVTVEDNIEVTAVCLDITVELDATGNATITAADIDGGNSDACGVATLAIDASDEDWTCAEVGANTVTLTVTDVNGNESSCDAIVTVEDNIAPNAVCQNITIQLDATGNATITAADIDGGSTDACGIASRTIDATDEDWTCAEVGTSTVTLTVTCVNGNVSTCDATVNVEDNVDPIAICQDITIELDATGNATITAADIDNGSNDACGIASTTIETADEDWTCVDVGTHIVTLTVTDSNGNTSTCDATVTVVDNIPPEALCVDITLELDVTGNASITAADIDGGRNDACGVATSEIDAADEDWTCLEVGLNTVTLTVTDINGNVSTCESTVTVEDNEAPTAVCQDITIQLDSNGNATIAAVDIDGGSADACGVASLAIDSSDEDWTCTELGINTVALTVTDANANVSTCNASVNVEDNVLPDAVCQNITIALDSDGEAYIVASDIDGGSTDACGIASIEIASEDEDWTCAQVGTNTATLTVTDVNGNVSSCDASVNVEDNTPPSLLCPDIEINLDPGLCGAVVDYDIESTDNCGVASEVTVSGPESGEYLEYQDGPWTVSVDVTDVNGNLLNCDFTITMNEFASPTETLACNDLIFVALDDDGCSIVTADMVLEGGLYGCYDDFIVSVESASAEVCCEDIGETLTVTVTDPDTGNFCEGTLEVFDNLSPYCVDISDYTIACEEELPSADDIGHIGYPVFGDNCGIAEITLGSELTIDGDICTAPGIQIERVWYAVDVNGNTTTAADACVQIITLERTPLTFPGDQIFDCASYDLEDLTPDLTGEPDPAGATLCMYSATYSDQILPTCGGLSKVVRTWTVIDWCTGDVITEDADGGTNVQILSIIDSEGPQIDAENLTVSTDSDQCAFTGFISAPTVTDNCSGVASIQIFVSGLAELDYVYGPGGEVIGGYVPDPGAALGTHTLLISAADSCGNISQAEVTLTVEDQITPTPVCDEITQVSLISDGTATVFAETFDDGSYDNCCLDGFEVTRMDDGNFGPSVLFDCSDIGNITQVILRVHDCYGNSNICMVEVLVEDKLLPYLSTPADTEIPCSIYYEDIAAALDSGDGSVLETMFGTAVYGDNCEAVVSYSYTYSVNMCGEGAIIRTWVVTDPSGNGPVSGSQTISIYHVSDWNVTFPADITADCVDGALPDFGEPIISGDDCEMIATTFVDTQFDVVPNACYKIVREWSAINWCTYPDEAAQTGIQLIEIVDTEAPIFDVEDFTVEITDVDCDVEVNLPAPDVTDCSDDITYTITSDLPVGEAGPGTYTANYVVSDGCGNYSYDQVSISVVDAKNPTPYLTDELVTEIMQSGMTLTVEADDFDIGSFDNCSDVSLSFSPDVNDTERIFDCSQLGPNTLEVWVTDAAGNQSFATVTLTVQDNMGVCGPGNLTVAGALTTEIGEGIEDATVEINGGLFDHITDETGTYSFDLEAGADYSVVPSLDLDVSNGVTTFDMVLVTQHILGMNTFTNPYQYIAADANNSNTITTLDAVAIRLVILQLADSFPNNTSWRFVDADHVFVDPTDPWGYPEVINYNNLDTDDLAADFIGVKIGDVNGTAQANFQSAAENRTNKNIQINTTDKQVQAGQEVTVHFTSTAAVSGYQFTLNHEGLEFVSIQEGLARAEHFGVHAGALTASWNDMEIRNLAGEDLFSVTFKATTNVQLSEVLTINSRYTQAEAYTTQGIEGVELTFSGQANTDYVLYQNVPNPFNGQTTIGFDLAKAGQASLRIMTIDGQTVKSITGDFAAGYNEVIIKDLKAVGVLYYSLESGDFITTKKMILIK